MYRFYIEGGNVSNSQIRFELSILSIPVAATVDFTVSRIGPLLKLVLLAIRDTFKEKHLD